MSPFNVTSGIAVTVICACIVAVLACGIRATLFSIKLPRPFIALCRVTLTADVVLIFFTAVQPWNGAVAHFEQEVIGICSVMVSISTTLIGLERVFALKCPLKYINYSEDCKLTSLIIATVYAAYILTYMCVRLLICYTVRNTVDIHVCMPYQVYFILTTETILMAAFSICFSLVCHTTATSRRQHTRRITRMGLPHNHAINATDTHCSAIVFVLYPCGMCLALLSVLLIYWPFIEDEIVSAWFSVTSRVVACTIHGVLFNFWFDEWRLHLLTLLSPLSGCLRKWSDTMRYNVYNIVIARAFDGSRLRLESTGKSSRTGRASQRNTVRISTVSGSGSFFSRSMSQKSISSSVHEQVHRTKVTKLTDIEETEV